MTSPKRLIWFLLTLTFLPAAYSQPAVLPDVFAECEGGGVVVYTLDGPELTGNSTDFTYIWSAVSGIRTGAKIKQAFPLGINKVYIEVQDKGSLVNIYELNVVVFDTRGPNVLVRMTPSFLPPTGEPVRVTANVEISDQCGGDVTFELAAVTSNDDPNFSTQLDFGTPDVELWLDASLTGYNQQRVYSIVYQGFDERGNVGFGVGRVEVDDDNIPFRIDPTELVFTGSVGRQAPAPQSVIVRSDPFGRYQVMSSAAWLEVSKTEGRTTDTVEISVDPSGLEPGFHNATVEFQSQYRWSRTLRVRYELSDRPQLFSLPEAVDLDFDVFTQQSSQAEPGEPLTSSVFVGTMHTSGRFTVRTDQDWLTATNGSGHTPTRILLTANPAGLSRGVNEAKVTIQPENDLDEPMVIPVKLDITSSAKLTLPEFLVNAATLQRRPVAPGSIVTGYWLNPDGPTAQADSTPLPGQLGGLSAAIGGEAVKFFFVSDRQFNAQLPVGLQPGVHPMEMRLNGSAIGTVPVQVVPAAPGIFNIDGKALALNQDGSLNGEASPASSGSFVSLFLTGQGATNPLLLTGQAAPAGPLVQPLLPVTCIIDGVAVPDPTVALAPGQIGMLQVNVDTRGLRPGEHQVSVWIGGMPSNEVTIYVQ